MTVMRMLQACECTACIELPLTSLSCAGLSSGLASGAGLRVRLLRAWGAPSTCHGASHARFAYRFASTCRILLYNL